MTARTAPSARPATDRPPMVRLVAGLSGLLTLGALLVIAATADHLAVSFSRGPATAWALLCPIVFSLYGLARHRDWGYWLGLAIGLTVVPWSAVLAFGAGSGPHTTAARVALAAALAILIGLAGGGAIRVGPSPGAGLDRTRSRWLRWTIIVNLASALNLFAFVVDYTFRVPANYFVLAALLIGLMGGVLLLARQKTFGLILVWLCCTLFVPAGAWFVLREAATAGEAVLFAVVFAPGVIAGWVTGLLFGRPLMALVRAD